MCSHDKVPPEISLARAVGTVVRRVMGDVLCLKGHFAVDSQCILSLLHCHELRH